MDPLIDKLAGYGLPGAIFAGVLFLMREQIAAALKPGDRVSPAELVAVIRENTASNRALMEQFKANNDMFHAVLEEAKDMGSTLTDIRIELARAGK